MEIPIFFDLDIGFNQSERSISFLNTVYSIPWPKEGEDNSDKGTQLLYNINKWKTCTCDEDTLGSKSEMESAPLI